MKYFLKTFLGGLLVVVLMAFLVGFAGQMATGGSTELKQASAKGQLGSFLVNDVKELFSGFVDGNFGVEENHPVTTNQEKPKSNDSATPIEPTISEMTLSNVYYYHFQPDLSDSVKDVFNKAIHTYNATGVVKLVPGSADKMQNSLTLGTYNQNNSKVQGNTMDMELGQGGPKTFQSNIGDWIEGTAKLNLYYPASISKAVATHEIGHALGLGHSKDPTSVMYPTDQGVSKLSKNDIKTLHKIYDKDNGN